MRAEIRCQHAQTHGAFQCCTSQLSRAERNMHGELHKGWDQGAWVTRSLTWWSCQMPPFEGTLRSVSPSS